MGVNNEFTGYLASNDEGVHVDLHLGSPQEGYPIQAHSLRSGELLHVVSTHRRTYIQNRLGYVSVEAQLNKGGYAMNYYVMEEWEGRGLIRAASETAIKATLEQDVHFDQLQFMIGSDNEASQRVAMKLGATFDKHVRDLDADMYVLRAPQFFAALRERQANV